MSEPDEGSENREGGKLFARLALLVAAVFFSGLLGAIGSQPFRTFADGYRATLALIGEWSRDRPELLGRISYPGEGLVKHDPARSAGGFTIIQGTLEQGAPQLRLLDDDGKELHRWKADFFAVWPDAQSIFPENRIPQSHYHYIIQGFWPLSDGSIVMNFGDLGTVKLDRCSQVVWRVPRMNHHSVTPTNDWGFWVPSHISVFDTPDRYFPRGFDAQRIYEAMAGDYHNYNNSILLIDAEGRVEKEFSVLEAVYAAGLEGSIYASMNEKVSDPTHVNDIDVVTEELAAKIESVSPGDLLVSIRNMQMVAILDQNSGQLKWHRQGPWFRHHDPDITEDGRIEIFNNRAKALGNHVTSSQIVSFDPADEEVAILHPAAKDDAFYTPIMGSHQLLVNGNRLIVESTSGRVFEATPTGEVVWDYRLSYNDEYAALFSHAIRLPADYFEGEVTCQASAN